MTHLLLAFLSIIPFVASLATGPFAALFKERVLAPDMSNMAQRILNLQGKVFDFCGGMPFELVLSDKLKRDLMVRNEVNVFDASVSRMSKIPGYRQSADADDVNVFYGREVRKYPKAAGGKGFALQLVASKDDPEGWSTQEIEEYNGWGHDSGRKWRKAADHAAEGNALYSGQFGSAAFGLHHRFYWHLDRQNGLWLSAEDGCEGVVRDW